MPLLVHMHRPNRPESALLETEHQIHEHSELLVYKQTRHALTRSDAHACQQDLLLLPPALTQPSHNLPCTRGAQRMAQSDCATPYVHLRVVDLQRFETVHGHASKSLVDFDDVDIRVEVEVELRKELGDGDSGADAHDTRGKAGDSSADKLGKNWLVELDGFGALHKKDGRRYAGERSEQFKKL